MQIKVMALGHRKTPGCLVGRPSTVS